jgi:hypothetical protein
MHHSRSSRADTQVSSSQVKLGNQTPNRIVRLPTTTSFSLRDRQLTGTGTIARDELGLILDGAGSHACACTTAHL